MKNLLPAKSDYLFIDLAEDKKKKLILIRR